MIARDFDFARLGQVQIDHRRGETLVPKILLDGFQAHASFE